MSTSLGSAIPALTAHAISVSLPTWQDNVGYEEGEKRVLDALVTGYPRFFIHLSIQKLASLCEQKFGLGGERCLLLATKRVANYCRSFMQNQWRSETPLNVRLIHFVIFPKDKQGKSSPIECRRCSLPPMLPSSCVDLHIVLFPADARRLAIQFWQHSGLGISSRLAEHCLSMLQDDTPQLQPPSPSLTRSALKSMNKHYTTKAFTKPPSPTCDRFVQILPRNSAQYNSEDLSLEQTVYVEERYGRNLPLSLASSAKKTLRRRIAGVLVHDNPTGSGEVEVGPSSRGVANVTEDDVYLFPTGMSAIWNAHNLALSVRPVAKSVCFGFPYTDTLKILQKWGPGCHFLGHGLDADIEQLELILKTEHATPPILALFTEFPSNPLLRSANLPRLRALADKYDFLIVIDETIGNFVNVKVLPYADIIVSSLTKVFSGDSNVMGGSLVLNPVGRHYNVLKAHMLASYEDIYFDEDAIYMERNSRDFRRRIKVIDSNAEAVCDFLRSRSVAGNHTTSPAIKEVFYPKWITRNNYEHGRIKGMEEAGSEVGGGFGGLFSLTFTFPAASRAFFDALPCQKGPSLGTNFTLACPYTILAHYAELEWAAQYGVEEGLVRISVGMEETSTLLKGFTKALEAAEATVAAKSESLL